MTAGGGRPAWRVAVDRGGTFTDIVAHAPDGRVRTAKLLSLSPAYADAAAEGIRRIVGDDAVAAVRMGTTVATNALLERAGVPVCLAVTRGFADALRIGHQARPRLFDRHIVLPDPLYAAVVEIDERVTAAGEVLTPLDARAAEAGLAAAFAAGCRAVAIVLLHGYRFPAHERALAALAARVGFIQVSVGHDVSPTIKLVPRGDTTVVDAYLSPVLRSHVDRVAAHGDTPLHFMQSNGGLTHAAAFRGKDAILSGPAGGVVGMVAVGRAAGFDRLIGFDMGGTSTDVSHWAGTFERATETVVAGVRLRTPMLAIDTVAAGGGSICRWDGTRLRVGPESAGAVPGPAAYGNGGPLTVTDAQVLLGRLQPAHFPAIFGPRGDAPLDTAAVAAGFAALAAETGLTPAALAEGVLDIAVATMARTIRAVSIERGHDVADYTLVAMGGAAGQVACRVAAALGIGRVLATPHAGVLSALGIALADVRSIREATVDRPLDADVGDVVDRLAAAARAAVATQDAAAGVAIVATALVKYAGTDTPLEVLLGDARDMAAAFADQHARRFGFASDAALVLDAVRVEAIGRSPAVATAPDVATGRAPAPAIVSMAGAAVPLFDRARLPAGFAVTGPAILVDAGATTIVEQGWTATITGRGDAVLRAAAGPARGRARADDERADPVRLELFNHRFMGIAEAMGVALQSTAASVTSRNGSIFRARSSMATARWWRTRRTCRSTSGRWATASPPCSAPAATRCGPVTP